MAMHVIETCDDSFELDVKSATSRLDVIEFSDFNKVNKRGEPNASARMDAVIDELAAEDANTGVRFFRVSVEFDKTSDPVRVTRNAKTAGQFDINHAPTVVLLRSESEKPVQVVGYYEKNYLQKQIENILSDQ